MRSFLFVPGDSVRKFESAKKTAADALILDLEDSIAPEGKVAARGITRQMLDARNPAQKMYIRVNALVAGAFRTPMLERVMERAGGATEEGRRAAEQRYVQPIPLGRIGRPEEAAEAAVWLCSDAASFRLRYASLARQSESDRVFPPFRSPKLSASPTSRPGLPGVRKRRQPGRRRTRPAIHPRDPADRNARRGPPPSPGS